LIRLQDGQLKLFSMFVEVEAGLHKQFSILIEA
jgi:hypothetical protein